MSLEQLWAGWRHEYVTAAGAAEKAGGKIENAVGGVKDSVRQALGK